ncbi:hypothetical protein [Streptomyces demainii]|uniref:Uncharacterized protein n=1 Tax=Streptomyces demainii TaxID=588122 RepID=A0ABT9KH56_9ACTN|nr:hypothetical protein [Streptomyces demainii]MDP9607749.1 hypothetical protein [Streptomyces demainii]
MVHPTPPHLSPEQRERLEQLADAARLRAALYPSPKPPPVWCRSHARLPVRLRTPLFPGGWCAWRATAARSRLCDPRVGQAPAQKAAKAARGQQPKKRPGKAQREAIKGAQAAKKKAGGGKPAAKKAAAKKAVPLPRGSVRAAYPGTCPACFKDYAKGEVITKVTDRWRHRGCAPRQLSAAEREFARNKARIESGETFRGQKPSDWRRGASPSSTRPAR